MEEIEEGDGSENVINVRIQNLVETMHQAHIDNAKLYYYARDLNKREFSQMPITPFIYEFFLFNSLYQVDWITSFSNNHLAHYPQDKTEVWKQGRFIKFIRNRLRADPELLRRAFSPLCSLEDLDGQWTHVRADSRISQQEGLTFFANIRDLKQMLMNSSVSDGIKVSKRRPDLTACVEYINKVRNNIFHGSKRLGETVESHQRQRLEVYELFLKGMNSLFFLVIGREYAACDIMPFALNFKSQSDTGEKLLVRSEQIINLTSRGLMKLGDSRLIFEFGNQVPQPVSAPVGQSALFYPSAGRDIFTPLLIALPYCNWFFFYEHRPGHTDLLGLARILSSMGTRDPGMNQLRWRKEGEKQVLDFSINGIDRTIFWCHSNNLEFLKENVDLRFYFHRGDSAGEGGSGQAWDSSLLPHLLSKVPIGQTCVYITDGHPGGLDKSHSVKTYDLALPSARQTRKYHCGEFSSSLSM